MKSLFPLFLRPTPFPAEEHGKAAPGQSKTKRNGVYLPVDLKEDKTIISC